MIALHEKGIFDQVDCVRSLVPTDDPKLPIFDDNPLGTIPTIVLEDGRSFYGSSVIMEYLDLLVETPRLFPAQAVERLAVRKHEALGDGILDTLFKWRAERRYPNDRSDILISRFTNKLVRALNELDGHAKTADPEHVDAGSITIACAISYIEFRFPDIHWALGRNALKTWYEEVKKRPAVASTPFREG
jgi:glutathione S-transferase